MNELNIYPNPSGDLIRISFSEQFSTEVIYIEVLDLSGRVVLAEQINNGAKTINMDVSKPDSGVYLIEISNREIKLTNKLIKQ